MGKTYNLFGEEILLKEVIINHNGENKINGLLYVPNFISKSEHNFLLDKIDKQPWLNDLKRKVQHYGFKYDYKYHRINYSMKIAELPFWLQQFAERLKIQGFFEETPDQVIVNEYLPGQGITNHVDCPPCFSDTVASLSLGSQCVMNFIHNEEVSEEIPYLLDIGSLIILKDEARYNWKHGIKLVKTDNYFGHKIKRDRRVSLTFRKVIIS